MKKLILIRSHMGLDGNTPAEAYEITIEGNNKWLTLIQNVNAEDVQAN